MFNGGFAGDCFHSVENKHKDFLFQAYVAAGIIKGNL